MPIIMRSKYAIYTAILSIPLMGGIAARLLRVTIAFILRDYGLSVFEITLLSSTFMLTRGVLSPIIGKFADKGYRRLLLITSGLLGLALDSYLYTVVPYPFMLFLRALDGMYGAMVWPSMQAFVHFAAKKDMKARLMSLYFIMGSLGMSIGYIVYNFLLGNLYNAIITVIVMQLSAAFVALIFRGFEREVRKVDDRDVVEKGHGKVPVAVYTITFLFGMFVGLGNEVLMFYLAEVMGMGKYATTSFLFFAGLYSLFGSYTTGFYADKISMDKAIVLTALFGMLSCVLISIDNLFTVILGTLLFYISGRAFTPLSRSYAASQTKNIGAALGYINMSSNFGAVLSPLIGGVIMDYFSTGKIGILNLAALTFVAMGIALLINTLILKRKSEI